MDIDRHDWSSLEGLDVPLHKACFNLLVTNAPNTCTKALALSSSIARAGDWFQVVPSTALDLFLHDWKFGLCLQYWLGVRVLEEGTRCPVCQVTTDRFVDHQVNCGCNGDHIHHHNPLRDALFLIA